MKIIEQFIESKTGKPEDCEDGIFVGKDFIAVIDGVTTRGKKLWGKNQVTSGVYAKDVLISAMAKMKPTISAEQAIEYLTNALKNEYGNNATDDVKERLQAVIVIYSAHHKQVWLYGDCGCLAGGKFYTQEMLTDKVTTTARSLYTNAMLLQGTSVEELLIKDPGRQVIQPLLDVEGLFANTTHEFGYPVLNGVNFNLGLIQKINIKTGDKVVLATDGYPKLFDTLAETEKYLANLLKIDPLLINDFKATKRLTPGHVSFDDRSYISFSSTDFT